MILRNYLTGDFIFYRLMRLFIMSKVVSYMKSWIVIRYVCNHDTLMPRYRINMSDKMSYELSEGDEITIRHAYDKAAHIAYFTNYTSHLSSVAAAQHVTEPRERVVVSDVQRLYLSTTRKCISSVSRSPWRRQCMETFRRTCPLWGESTGDGVFPQKGPTSYVTFNWRC